MEQIWGVSVTRDITKCFYFQYFFKHVYSKDQLYAASEDVSHFIIR